MVGGPGVLRIVEAGGPVGRVHISNPWERTAGGGCKLLMLCSSRKQRLWDQLVSRNVWPDLTGVASKLCCNTADHEWSAVLLCDTHTRADGVHVDMHAANNNTTRP